MRTLNFIVNQQHLKRDPNTDFSNIVMGTVGYLEAAFTTTGDWNGCALVACFTGNGVEEYIPVINGKCEIPSNVLGDKAFTVQLIGANGNDFKIVSTREIILQKKR